MIYFNNNPAKRHVRSMRKAAIRNDRTYALLDCWGNRVGMIDRNGNCYVDNLNLRQVVHIVAGAIINQPRENRTRQGVQSWRNLRSFKEWNAGRGLV